MVYLVYVNHGGRLSQRLKVAGSIRRKLPYLGTCFGKHKRKVKVWYLVSVITTVKDRIWYEVVSDWWCIFFKGHVVDTTVREVNRYKG